MANTNRKLVATLRRTRPAEDKETFRVKPHGRIFVDAPEGFDDIPWRQQLKLTRTALAEIDIRFAAAKIGFSRNAGCACGCSPGFIAREEDGAWNLRGNWHWVDLAWAPIQ